MTKIPVAYSRCIALSLILSPPQLDSVFSDVRIDTTKIGMLAETDIVEAVAERLQRYQIQNVVLDTVMLAKSGNPLLSPSAVATLRSRLLPQVSLITPNLPEAAALLDTPHARNEQEMLAQGREYIGDGLWRGADERWSSG
ncbi:bifunctional hydroxymethylpyrimidine kinase/phosphomethylpyrimidine kinase [Escherichia coli]